MKKIILTIFVSLFMTVSLLTPGTAVSLSADDEPVDVDKSIGTVITSINELKAGNVIQMTDQEAASMTGTFDDFTKVFGKIGSIIAPINGAVSFLRMIGVMKDPTSSALAHIQSQLEDISNKLTQMDQKLNEIASAMDRLQATEEFHFRAIQAKQYRDSWDNFQTTYMEKGLDTLMLQYDTSLRDAWKNWFSSANQSQPDTDSVLIWYMCTNAPKDENDINNSDQLSYKLQTTLMNGFDAENGRPAGDYSYILYKNEFDTRYDRLISLDGSFFADAKNIQYDIDTYRDDLKNYIKDKISSDDETGIKLWNLKKEDFDADQLEEIADQAVDMISYKFSYKIINDKADFPSGVLKQYNDYCENLLKASKGINALFKTMYFTHAFEFETRQDLLNSINLLNLQTGVYSAFVANIIGDATTITNDEKEAFTKTMCDTLDAIAEFKETAITGEDRYCYLTGSIIDYGSLHISSEASIDWRTALANTLYKDCHGGSMNYSITDSSNNRQDAMSMVGDASALLISYMLRSNGQTFDHNYMNEHLAVNKQADNNGVVTTYHGEQVMVQDTDIKLSSYSVTGSYFSGNPELNLKSLPSDAEFGYVNIHRMATGSLFNGADSTFKINRPLLAVAVYGESHAAWRTDESALMYGPKDTGRHDFDVQKKTTYEDTFLTEYNTSVRESADYNALLSLPVKDSPATTNEDSPVNCYYKDYETAIDDKGVEIDAWHVHRWDEGTIITPATEETAGLVEYTCLAEKCYGYSYTELYANYEMAELTFDLDGGRLDGFDNELSRQFRIGRTIKLPTTPEKDGYTFQYWGESEHPAESEYEVKGDRTFKAVWIKSKEYKFDKDSDSEWYNESRKAPYIRIYRAEDSKETLAHFREVRLFDTPVDPSNYEVYEGSLILKFRPEYLKSLPSGALKFKVLFDDGVVEFVLNVRNGLPKDGNKEYRVPITGIEY